MKRFMSIQSINLVNHCVSNAREEADADENITYS